MCGDGANDCGALKAANIGVSLSDLEASIAAPFTSQEKSISSVPTIIKEGRAALVTSFMCFKFMALYSLIQFSSLLLLYSVGKAFGNWQFLYIDLYLILTIALVIGRTAAYPTLSVSRPTASLISSRVLTSIIGHVALQFACQIGVFLLLRQQPWYTSVGITGGKLTIVSYESTVLFFLSSYQYISMAIVFSSGKPYRRPMYTNVAFVLVLLLLTSTTGILLYFPHHRVYKFMQMKVLPVVFRQILGGIAIAYFFIALICEEWIFPMIASLFRCLFSCCVSRNPVLDE